jgi:hypothetical protein
MTPGEQAGPPGRAWPSERFALLDLPPCSIDPAALLRGVLPYALAMAVYVGIGVWQPRVMLNWAPAIVLLLAVAWGLPALLGRRRR